ncbi:MAG: M56 family metallopeptidase, partial [Verrucomicrobiota bacterium]
MNEDLMVGLLVEGGWKSTLWLGLCGLLVLFLRRSSAAVRHGVWTMGMVGAVVIPLGVVVLPGWSAEWLWEREVKGSGPAFPINDRVNSIVGEKRNPNLGELPTMDERQASASRVPTPRERFMSHHGSWNWVGVAVLVWGSGVMVVLLRLGKGYGQLSRLARRAESGNAIRWERELRQISGGKQVRVLTVKEGVMPMTWGLWRPVILLPESALAWEDDRLRMVLQHELAHVQRGDWGWQLVGQIGCLIHWYNPLVWVACLEMRKERERACDDLVVVAWAEPEVYASVLLDVALDRQHGGRVPSVALAVARTLPLEGRIQAILDYGRDRSGFGRRGFWGAMIAVLGLALPLATFGEGSAEDPARPGDSMREFPSDAMKKDMVDPSVVGNAGDVVVLRVRMWNGEKTEMLQEVKLVGAIGMPMKAHAGGRAYRPGIYHSAQVGSEIIGKLKDRDELQSLVNEELGGMSLVPPHPKTMVPEELGLVLETEPGGEEGKLKVAVTLTDLLGRWNVGNDFVWEAEGRLGKEKEHVLAPNKRIAARVKRWKQEGEISLGEKLEWEIPEHESSKGGRIVQLSLIGIQTFVRQA